MLTCPQRGVFASKCFPLSKRDNIKAVSCSSTSLLNYSCKLFIHDFARCLRPSGKEENEHKERKHTIKPRQR